VLIQLSENSLNAINIGVHQQKIKQNKNQGVLSIYNIITTFSCYQSCFEKNLYCKKRYKNKGDLTLLCI